jgi:hypothetical protein
MFEVWMFTSGTWAFKKKNDIIQTQPHPIHNIDLVVILFITAAEGAVTIRTAATTTTTTTARYM